MIGDAQIPDENVNNQRRSERARKPVQQIHVPQPSSKSSPRTTVTPKKLVQNPAPISNTPSYESSVYIELDPFAPPPRLSLNGNNAISGSPCVSSPQTKLPIIQKQALPAYSGGILFEQLNSSGIALKTVINDWMNMYESDQDRKGTVSLLLVNLILWSSRIEEDIKPENCITESANQILHDLQERIEPSSQGKSDFPLIERNKKHRVFRMQYSDFWINWAALVLPAVKDLELIEKVILPWLISMTSAAYRPIRYAATLAILDIIQGCCQACVSMHKELETASRVMNSKKSNLASKKAVEALSSRTAEIEKLMQLSIDAVFVQRYRDVDALIREKCVESIHSWIMTYPEVFLDNAYLRYIGWSLSDKVSHVRLSSLAAWKSICSRNEFRAALTNFVNRFKSRLFEVLSRDVDRTCRENAGVVIDILFSGSFIEVEEMSFVDDLIFSGDSTISTLYQLMSQRIFNLPYERISSTPELLNRFAGFIVPFINSESSAETNNFLLTQLIINLREKFPIISDRSLSASLLKTLISQTPNESEYPDQEEGQSETSEKISSLLAILFAQVQSVKSRKGTSWTFEDSSDLFNFVNDLIKFINDNEREIYSKDIFYLFSLLNEVDSSKWLEISGISGWESLLPILTELFCSIDDMESAKVATIFFKKAKMNEALKGKTNECIEMGGNRLLNELIRKIPGNMRDALKIKDNTLLTLILPLAHINLIKSLEIEDSSTVLASILNMTKLIDEFVTIEEGYKTTIWTCSIKLCFHELMWKMLHYRSNESESEAEIIIDLKDRLIDLISPVDLIPEKFDSLTIETFERVCTCINVLSDLSLLFTNGSNSGNASWSVILLSDQIMALLNFIKMITKIVSEPLPKREDESFELVRATKKAYPSILASMAKLFSLEIIPQKHLSNLFLTFGFAGDDLSDSIIKIVMERFISKLTWDKSIPIISSSLQESYLICVMSSEYERLIKLTTVPLAKSFNDILRKNSVMNSSSESLMFNLHSSSIDFFAGDCNQRSEFLGKILSQFVWNLPAKPQAADLISKLKNQNYSDTFVSTYMRLLVKIAGKGNLAQQILMKRSNISSPSAKKSLKLERIPETILDEKSILDPTDLTDPTDQIEDYVGEVDLITQKEINDQVISSPPPAMLKRNVMRY